MSPHRRKGTHVSQDEQVFDSVEYRAAEIVARLPPGSFTVEEFLSHGTGLNAVDNVSDVGPMLKHLTDTGVIRRVSEPHDEAARWVRADHPGRT
jgi:hypothetical protein